MEILSNNLSSIITGIVSVVALWLGYLQNQRNNKIHLATTIEKEWLENIRKDTISILNITAKIIEIRQLENKGIILSDNIRMFKDESQKMWNSQTSLLLLLNKNRPIEQELLSAISTLYYKLMNVTTEENLITLAPDIVKIKDAAHSLFDSKKAGYKI